MEAEGSWTPIVYEVKTTRRVNIKPKWLRVRVGLIDRHSNMMKFFQTNKLSTICQSAACPNLPECFNNRSVALLVMGTKCTRVCSFCNVEGGPTLFLEPIEVFRVTSILMRLGLSYTVITSVDRDDLDDGGAQHFARCAKEIGQTIPTIQTELLLPDFRNKARHIVFNARHLLPHVMNHNIETVPRLYATAKSGSKYYGSLALICQLNCLRSKVKVKSGLVLGLGESIGEIVVLLRALEGMTDCIIIGQYLRPNTNKAPANDYLHPNAFSLFRMIAIQIGFKGCWSHSMARSSFKAAVSYSHFGMSQ